MATEDLAMHLYNPDLRLFYVHYAVSSLAWDPVYV
jgi:hypothetical protein